MTDPTRRRFLQYGMAASAALALPRTAGRRLAATLPGGLTKFREPLPVPGAGIVVATPNGANQYSFTLREIARKLHPDLPPTHCGHTTTVPGWADRRGRSVWRWSHRAARHLT
jgi:hypothetical protein